MQYGGPNEEELGLGALGNSRVWSGVDITHSNLMEGWGGGGMEKSSGLGVQWTWVLDCNPVLTGCIT